MRLTRFIKQWWRMNIRHVRVSLGHWLLDNLAEHRFGWKGASTYKGPIAACAAIQAGWEAGVKAAGRTPEPKEYRVIVEKPFGGSVTLAKSIEAAEVRRFKPNPQPVPDTVDLTTPEPTTRRKPKTVKQKISLVQKKDSALFL